VKQELKSGQISVFVISYSVSAVWRSDEPKYCYNFRRFKLQQPTAGSNSGYLTSGEQIVSYGVTEENIGTEERRINRERQM
jgi:hypothetical protein